MNLLDDVISWSDTSGVNIYLYTTAGAFQTISDGCLMQTPALEGTYHPPRDERPFWKTLWTTLYRFQAWQDIGYSAQNI